MHLLLAVAILLALSICSTVAFPLVAPKSTTGTTSQPTDPTKKTPQNRQRSFLEQVDRVLTKLQNPKAQLESHTYLSGNYAPVQEEHVQVPLNNHVVSGSIPPTLNGIFCRNGPNPIRSEGSNDDNTFRKCYHWFDGHAMLHNMRFEDGQAFYTNQYVPSIRYQIEEELGEDYFPTLGEYKGFWGLLKVLFHPDMVRQKVPNLMTVLPPNTNVIMYNDRFYCLNEGNLPYECQMLPNGTLQPVGYESFDGKLDYPISAHPQVDEETGDLLFHSYTTNVDLIEEHGTMKVGRYNGKDKILHSYFVPNESKDYISFAHGMVHSENHMIIWDCSVHFDPVGMFDGGNFFRTKDTHNLRFGVVPKDATSREDVVWIDTGSMGAVVHPLNAWEEGDEIVLWTPFCANLVVDLESSDINKFDMVEYRFQISTGKLLSKKVIDDSVNVEFSVVPSMGKFTRFGYTAIQDPSTPGEGSFSGFCIWDMSERKLHKSVYYPKHEVGGEPMVARDDVTGKTYVASYVYNMKEEISYFVLYDGTTGDLVCRIQMPYRVPFGFHGQWISQQDLDGHFRHHGIPNTTSR